MPADASAEAVLQAYADKVDELKARGGYTAADVIHVTPRRRRISTRCSRNSAASTGTTKTKSASSSKAAGCFISARRAAPVFAIEVEAGDLISVPRGTHHWFDLCAERRIRAIRLFQDASGWTPHYTDSGVDANFQPLCFGPSFVRGEDLDRRDVMPVSLSALQTRAIVLDVEGTTTPVEFVYTGAVSVTRAPTLPHICSAKEIPTRCQPALDQLHAEQRDDRARGLQPPGAARRTTSAG